MPEAAMVISADPKRAAADSFSVQQIGHGAVDFINDRESPQPEIGNSRSV
jgi:hypothetical protein